MTNSKLNLGLIFFLFVLFTGMTFAINVNSCGTISAPGTYDLINNLNGASTSYDIGSLSLQTCIVVNSSNVTLDCHDYVINGLSTNDAGIIVYSGTQGDYLTNVTVKNCRIESYNYGGLYLVNVNNSLVDNNDLYHNSNESSSSNIMSCTGGINILESEFVKVQNNYARNNSFGFCVAHITASSPYYSYNNTFSNNEGVFNRFTGFGIAGGSYNNTISGNDFTDNMYGLIIGAAYSNTFDNLLVARNKYVDFAPDPVLYTNQFCQNNIDAAKASGGFAGGTIDITGGKKLFLVDVDSVTTPPGFTPNTNQIIVCAKDLTIRDMSFTGDSTYKNNGIFVLNDGLTVDNLVSTNLTTGLYVQTNKNVIVQNSTFRGNKNGMLFNGVENADISNNLFEDNTAVGLAVTTSPIVLLEMLSVGPITSQISNHIDIYDNVFLNSGDGTSVKDAYPGAMSTMVGTIYPGDVLDLATGSATLMFFVNNVTYHDNYIYNSSSYGFSTLFMFDSTIENNEIELVRGVTAFNPTPGGLFDNPQFTAMLAIVPGTGILYDGAKSDIKTNNVTESTNGFVSLPLTSSLGWVFGLFGHPLPSGPVMVEGNRLFDNTFAGIGLTSSVIARSNFVYDNAYGLILGGENNTLINNFFNNTDYFFMVVDDYNSNMSIPKNDSLGLNIIGGTFWGGNYWGLTNGNGHSDKCTDNGEGFCTTAFNLNSSNSNNTDYLPLTSPKVVVGDCVDLDKPSTYVSIYGNVKDYDRTFYINGDTKLCKKTYYTDRLVTAVVEGNYMQMNGSYVLDCNGATFINDVPGSKYLIGISNKYSDVVIKNCNFVKFDEGVVSSQDSRYLTYGKGRVLFTSPIYESIVAKDPMGNLPYDDMTLYNSGYTKKKLFLTYDKSIYVYNSSYEQEENSISYGNYNKFKTLKTGEILLYNNTHMWKTYGSKDWTVEFSLEAGSEPGEPEPCLPSWRDVSTGSVQPNSLAVSGDGSTLFLTNYSGGNGYIYRSFDNGTTWSNLYTQFMYSINSLESSNGGATLIAVRPVLNDVFFYSAGAPYSLDLGTNPQFADISDDGQKALVGTSNGTIYYCTSSCWGNYGWNWGTIYAPLPTENIYGMKMSGDGNTIITQLNTTDGNYYRIYSSGMWSSYLSYPTNYIVNFTNNEGIAISDDGTKVVTGLKSLMDGQYYIFIYNVTSGQWTNIGVYGSHQWKTISMSGDGQTIIAGMAFGNLIKTTNGGYNSYDWAETLPSNYWELSDMSNDGEVMFATNQFGNSFVYSATCEATPPTPVMQIVSRNILILEHPTTGDLYVSVLAIDPALGSSKGTVLVYNKSDGSLLWNATFDVSVQNILIAFDNDDNLVVNLKDAEEGSLIYVLDYETGEILSEAKSPVPKDELGLSMGRHMFIGSDDLLYEASLESSIESKVKEAGVLDTGGLRNESILKLYKYNMDEIYNSIYEFPAEYENYSVITYAFSGDGNTIVFSTYSDYDMEGKLFVSTDKGKNWDEADIGTSIRLDQIYVSSNGAVILTKGSVAEGEDVYLSTDSGNTWLNINDRLAGTAYYQLRYLSDDGNTMYITDKGYGIHRSLDKGATWTNINSTLPEMPDTKYNLALNKYTLVLSRSQNVSISKDNGNTWSAWKNLTNYSTGFEFTISKTGKVIVAIEKTEVPKIFISKDDGTTWTLITLPEKVKGLYEPLREGGVRVSMSDNGRYIILLRNGEIFQSDDTGNTFTRVEFEYPVDRSFTSADGSINYLVSDGGMVREIYVYGEDYNFLNLGSLCPILGEFIISSDAKDVLWYVPVLNRTFYLADLDKIVYDSKEYVVNYVSAGTPGAGFSYKFESDGNYLYYIAQDSATGSKRLNYKVFNLNLKEIRDAEFKPNYIDVNFTSYVNLDTGDIEFLGKHYGNNSEDNLIPFTGLIDKEDAFRLKTDTHSDNRILPLGVEFVEVDKLGNTVMVGYNKYPRATSIKLVKYDANGKTLFDKNYNLGSTNNVMPTSFIITSDNNYLIGGYFVNSQFNYQYFVLKVRATDGAVMRTQTFNMENTPIIDVSTYDVDLLETAETYAVFMRNGLNTNIEQTSKTSLEVIGELNTTMFSKYDFTIASDGTNACLLYTTPIDVEMRNVELLDLTTFESDFTSEVGVNSDDNIEIDGTDCYYHAYLQDTWPYKTIIGKINLTGPSLLGEITDVNVVKMERILPHTFYVVSQHTGGPLNKVRTWKVDTSSGLNYLAEFNYTIFGRDIAPKSASFNSNRLSFAGEGYGRSSVGYFVASYVNDKFSWEKANIEALANTQFRGNIIDMGPIDSTKSFAVEFVREIDISDMYGPLDVGIAGPVEPIKEVPPVSTHVNVYTVDDYGNFEKLFTIDRSMSYPLKTVKTKDYYYVLMGDMDQFSFTNDNVDTQFGEVTNMVLYKFDNNGKQVEFVRYNSAGTVAVYPDEISTGFNTISFALSRTGAMAYDEKNKQLVIAGSKFGESIVVGGKGETLRTLRGVHIYIEKEDNPNPIKKTIYVDDAYIFTFVQDIQVLDDGYLIVGGGIGMGADGPSVMETFLLKTDFEGNQKGLNFLLGEEVQLCSGGWTLMENRNYDFMEISGDGTKLITANRFENGGLLYTSTNNGLTWTETGPYVGTGRGWYDVDISSNGQTLLGVESMGGGLGASVAMSFDGGTIWSLIPHPVSQFRQGEVSSNGQTLLVAMTDYGRTDLFRCNSGSACAEMSNWYTAKTFENVIQIYQCDYVPYTMCYWINQPRDIYPDDMAMSGDGNVIALHFRKQDQNYNTYSEIQISFDGGMHFNTIPIGVFNADQYNVYTIDLSVSETGDAIIARVESNNGRKVFISTNYGNSWNELNFGSDNPRVSSISDDGVILIGDDSRKLYLSKDNGATWSVVASGVTFQNGFNKIGLSTGGDKRFVLTNGAKYFYTGPEVCKKETPNLVSIPVKAFKINFGGEETLFVTYTIIGGRTSPQTIATTLDGEVIGVLGEPIQHMYQEGNFLHMMTYDPALYGGTSVSAIKGSKYMRFNMLKDPREMQDLKAYIQTQPEAIVNDFQPTSYGILGGGVARFFEPAGLGVLAAPQPTNAGFVGYTMSKAYSKELSNITLENIGIFNDDDTLLIDTTGTGPNKTGLIVGCSDIHSTKGARCSVTFKNDITQPGYLILGLNSMIEREFVSIDTDDANARAFQGPVIIVFTTTGGNIKIYRSDGFYKTRKEIIENGVLWEPPDLKVEIVGDEKRITFTAPGFSSYALGISGGGDTGPSGPGGIHVTFTRTICEGDEYPLLFRKITGDFASPLEGVSVRIMKGDEVVLDTVTDYTGIIKFIPERGVTYQLYTSKEGYADYNDMLVVRFKDATVCLEPLLLCDPAEGRGYTLALDSVWPVCNYVCSITECPSGYSLEDTGDECWCQAPDDKGSEMLVTLSAYEVCDYEIFTVSLDSDDPNCISNVGLSIPAVNIKDIVDENLDLYVGKPGTYDVILHKEGCYMSPESVKLKVISCVEPFEEIIEPETSESFWEQVVNIFRSSIKGGCEGFYFEGIPTILCDLVWVVVVVGSVVGAYLEPERNRKVIILLAPSIVAIVLVPVAGAVAAAGGVYLAYNSKKHVEGKLGVEKEQMEEEIKKE